MLRCPNCLSILSGLLPVAAIVAVATWAARELPLERFGVGTLSLSLLAGMLLGNALRLPAALQPGVHFAQQKLLRLGVMLFGLHVSIGQLLQVGWQALGIDLAVMSLILIGGIWIGIRWFGLERDLAVMTAAGSAICGAAAVLATEPVVRGSSAHTSMAVATVVLFGTLAILIYPLIYHFSGINPHSFGIYVGATVHEVAQVVAVGHSIGGGAEETAVIVKLLRVMLLAPVLLLLSLWWRRSEAGGAGRAKLSIPWFAFGFVGVVIVNSLWPMSSPLHAGLETLDTLLLAAAMAALGLETRFARLRVLGLKPLLFAGLLFVMLAIGGDLLTRWLLPV
ncbi:MAG TPA: putative sulfate exporter family transporter [Mariprofundaceae bacterium]|nr:putative sulfate exporter family transporter [Mariprofundaceae bacterium]